MIDHTGVSITDPVRARRFYEQALAPLGYKVLMVVPVEFTGGVMVLGMGVPPKPDFWLHEGTPQKPHVHIAFRADNRAAYGDVVRVVAIIRNSGIRNLGLVAEDEESK